MPSDGREAVSTTVHELFETQAARTPEAVAAVQGTRAWTYGELNARANQVARHLRKLGAGRDVPVGVCLSRGLDLAATLLGVMKAGSPCLPLDPEYPAERLAFIERDAQALVRIDGKVEYGVESSENLPAGAQPDDLAYVIYTSGSTGTPRGVMLTHRGLVNHHLAAIDLYGLCPSDRVLQSASISFDISLEEMFPAWSVGAAVVFRTAAVSLQARPFLRWVGEQRITVLDLPTAYWHELAAAEMAFPECVRLVIVGGEKASPAAYRSWRKFSGERIRWINTYGPTEASIIATAYEPVGRDPEDLSELPIGRPIANTRIHIPDGDTGEMYIAGAGVARGYVNRPELTAEKFVDGMYRTGDLGRRLPDGNFEFLGRTDLQVKIRGYRVEPGEIEAVLERHPGVRQAAVVSNERGLAAYVRSAKGELPDLRAFLEQRLPEYMIPFAFVPVASYPMTPNGKVDRTALAGMALPRETKLSARDEVEARMVRVWETVFGIQPVSVRDNFFELGGHSLLALRLMHRMELEFGRTLPPAVLFQAPTVERLCDILRQEGWTPRWASLVPIQPSGSQMPFFCVHGLGGHVMRFGALARQLGPDQPFYGLQSRGLDGCHTCDATVEEMAVHYIEEIRSLQPRGPYRVGGYSFGGAVAYEMARQLSAAGEEVEFLALLDAYAASGSLVDTFFTLSLRERLAYIVSKRGLIARRIRSNWEALRYPVALKRVHAANRQAERAYGWPAYEGPVWLFRASEKGLRGLGGSFGERWQIHEVEADHGSMLREPTVRDLAQRMIACMDAVGSPCSV